MSDEQIADIGPDGNLARSNDAVLAMHALLLSIQIPEHLHRNESWQQYLSYRPLHEIGDTAHANALAELLTDREVLEWARRADDLLETAARTVRVHGPEHVRSPNRHCSTPQPSRPRSITNSTGTPPTNPSPKSYDSHSQPWHPTRRPRFRRGRTTSTRPAPWTWTNRQRIQERTQGKTKHRAEDHGDTRPGRKAQRGQG